MQRHRTIVLGSLLSIVGVAATTLVGFYMMPFLVHRLGDRLYGYWALIGAVLGYYGILDLGISPAVGFQVAKAIGAGDRQSPNRTISTAVVAFTGLGLVVLALTSVVAALCPFFIANATDAKTFRIVIMIVGTAFAFGFPGRAFAGGVYAHVRNDLIALISLALLAVKTFLTIAVILEGGGLVGIAFVSLVIEAVSLISNYLTLRMLQHDLHISMALADRATFKDLFDYGRYSMVIRVGDQFRFAVDGWTVAGFVGVSAVTHYTIASRLAGYFLSFILSAVGLLQSWFSQMLGSRDFDGIRRVLTLGTRVSAWLSTIVLCSFLFYGRSFISTWMGARYVDAYWPSIILLAAVFCDLAQQPSVTYLLGVSRHRYLAIQTLAEGIANLALSIYWARSYGMIGVAMGTLIPSIVAKVVLQPVYVCQSSGIPLGEYFAKVLGRAVIAPSLCTFGLWALVLRRINPPNVLAVCLVMGLQAAASMFVSFYFVFSSEDRQRLLSKLFPQRKVEGVSANVQAAELGDSESHDLLKETFHAG